MSEDYVVICYRVLIWNTHDNGNNRGRFLPAFVCLFICTVSQKGSPTWHTNVPR